MGALRFLLDTCTLVDQLRGHAPAMRLLAKERRAAVSTITWMEVMAEEIDEEAGSPCGRFSAASICSPSTQRWRRRPCSCAAPAASSSPTP